MSDTSLTYALEKTYTESRLTPEEITTVRQRLHTKKIIGRLRSKMDVLLCDGHPFPWVADGESRMLPQHFLDSDFYYTDDGKYSIDNNVAERCIRPLFGERKNSLFFRSHKMARASAIYNTIIAICLVI